MNEAATIATYRRKKDCGTLRLGKVVDIFEATALLGVARRAEQDPQATTICVDCSQVERLDLTALQILLALRRDLEAAQRQFIVEGLSSCLTKTLNQQGFAF